MFRVYRNPYEKLIYISSCTFQGFVLGDLVALVAHAKREAYRAVLKHW